MIRIPSSSIRIKVRIQDFKKFLHYLRRRLSSEGIVTLGFTLSRCVCVRRISLGGESNALYPVLSSLVLRFI